MGAAGGGVGRRRAPGWPRWAVKETVHPPSLVSRWREALPPQVQAWRNSETAAWTLSRFDILAEAHHSETGWRGFYPPPLKNLDADCSLAKTHKELAADDVLLPHLGGEVGEDVCREAHQDCDLNKKSLIAFFNN